MSHESDEMAARARRKKRANGCVYWCLVMLCISPFLYGAYEVWRTISVRAAFVPLGFVVVALVVAMFGARHFRADSSPPAPAMRVRPPSLTNVKDTPLSAKVLDMGIVTFWGENTAFAHRKHPIPVTAEAIQPFVKVSLSDWGRWHIIFKVCDNANRVIFQYKMDYFLDAGGQFITPPARIRLGEHIPQGEWTLDVSVNEIVDAQHHFTWRSDAIERLENSIDVDGEIDEAALALLADNYAKPLSLDDLLAKNDDQIKEKGSTLER
jgi:hypothetical protein